MKMFELRFKFHWNLFLGVKITIFQHWFRLWLGAVQATIHYLNQWWLMYALLGLNGLIRWFDCRCLAIWLIQNFTPCTILYISVSDCILGVLENVDRLFVLFRLQMKVHNYLLAMWVLSKIHFSLLRLGKTNMGYKVIVFVILFPC